MGYKKLKYIFEEPRSPKMRLFKNIQLPYASANYRGSQWPQILADNILLFASHISLPVL
jgi:hypothetical protein